MFSFILGLLIGSSIWLLSSTLIEYFIERDRRKEMDDIDEFLYPYVEQIHCKTCQHEITGDMLDLGSSLCEPCFDREYEHFCRKHAS